MSVVAPGVVHEMLSTETLRVDEPVDGCSAFARVSYLMKRKWPHGLRQVLLWWWLLRYARRYDVIHFHTHVDRYFITYLICKALNKKILLSATLDDSVVGLAATYRKQLRWLAYRGLSVFDGYVSLSPRCHNETRSVVDPSTAHLIANGVFIPERGDGAVRVEARQRLGIAEDDIVFIFVGGICERKDPFFLIKMLPEILKSTDKVKVLIVGPVLEPEYFDQISAYIEQWRLTDHVIFTGEVANSYPFFAIADVMTFPSWMEGCPAALVEAMAHGLPCVVRDLPGINDSVVINGTTGFHFSNDTEYVEALRKLISTPGLRHRLGDAARQFAIDHFDIVDIATEYLKVYGVVVKNAPGENDDAKLREFAALPASASIIDPRFRRPIVVPPEQPPLLVTTVDAEEDFDWNKPFTRAITDVSSMAHQHLAHPIFERYGVCPMYMLDYPVASQSAGYGPLADYVKDGRCELGTQLHPWVNPPFLEELNSTNSFPGNLPLSLEFEKLKVLTETIEARLGVRPRVYRAGRYGVGPRTADILRRLGYRVDVSVVPQRSFARQGGPDFFGFPATPYWTDAECTLLEMPLTAGVVGALAGPATRLGRHLFRSDNRGSVLTAVLAHTHAAEQIRLTPEGITIDEAKKLVRAMLAGGLRVFTLTYHSPSLLPGSTPYVRSPADRDRLLAWLDQFYEFFFGEIGGKPTTADKVYDLALGLRSAPAAIAVDPGDAKPWAEGPTDQRSAVLTADRRSI